MIEGCHRDALCQIDVASDVYRSDDGTMQANAGITANGDIAHSIVDAAIGFNDTVSSQPEATIGRSVHPDAMVDFRPTTTTLIQRCQQPDIPARTGIALIHDEEIETSLQLRIAFQSFSQCFFVFHVGKITK